MRSRCVSQLGRTQTRVTRSISFLFFNMSTRVFIINSVTETASPCVASLFPILLVTWKQLIFIDADKRQQSFACSRTDVEIEFRADFRCVIENRKLASDQSPRLLCLFLFFIKWIYPLGGNPQQQTGSYQ